MPAGNANTSAVACSETVGGATYACMIIGSPALIAAGAGPVGLVCTSFAAAGAPAAGSQVTGAISLANGASVPFSGVQS